MKSTGVALTSLLALVMTACVTVPVVHDPSGVDLAVTALNERQVMIYYGQGGPFDPDPYLAPSGLLAGQPYDFIVLRIEAAAATASSISLIGATARDQNGTVVARASSKRQLLELLRRGSLDDRQYNEFALKVEQSYFPDRGTELHPGRRAFAVVLAGRHPLPEPLTIDVRLEVGDGTLRAFQVAWPR